MNDLAGLDREDWRRALMRIGDAQGFYKELGPRHTALHARAGDTLVVTFENLDHVYDFSADRLPWGFGFVRARGWSILGLMAHDWTWYRDPAVWDFFDELRDTGFFDDFRRVVFYGASMGGYAAAAFSAAHPGATVVTISPQATLDRAVVPWETRYRKAWDRDFHSRYGYAPDMIASAGRVYLFHDPMAPLDAGHARLFRGDNILRLDCRHMGHRIASAMQGMGILKPVVEGAIEGSLTRADFYRLLRARRDSPRYWREMLGKLSPQERPRLTAMLCRAYLARWRGPKFRAALRAAEAELERRRAK